MDKKKVIITLEVDFDVASDVIADNPEEAVEYIIQNGTYITNQEDEDNRTIVTHISTQISE